MVFCGQTLPAGPEPHNESNMTRPLFNYTLRSHVAWAPAGHCTDLGSHGPARRQHRGQLQRWVVLAPFRPVRRPAARGWDVNINRGLGCLPSGRVGEYWVAIPNGFLNREAMELMQLTPAQLRQAAALKERIDELEHELESLLGTSATATPSRKLHWTQTPAGRARLARSLRRSWRTRRRS